MSTQITLTKIVTEDAFPLVAQLLFNEEVMVMNMGRVFTEAEAEQYFAYMLASSRAHRTEGVYALHLKEDGTFIGIASLQADGLSCEVEYMILPDFWHQGYATEAVSELIKLSKETPNIQTIRGLTDPLNIPSQKVLIKNGFILDEVRYVQEDNSSVNVYTLAL